MNFMDDELQSALLALQVALERQDATLMGIEFRREREPVRIRVGELMGVELVENRR